MTESLGDIRSLSVLLHTLANLVVVVLRLEFLVSTGESQPPLVA